MKIDISFNHMSRTLLSGITFLVGIILIFIDKSPCILGTIQIIFKRFPSEIILSIVILTIMYEIGLIINTLGSAIIEKFLLFMKIVKFSDYNKFAEAKKSNEIVRSNAHLYYNSRSRITVYFLLFICAMFRLNFGLAIIFLALILIYGFYIHKYSEKINRLVS